MLFYYSSNNLRNFGLVVDILLEYDFPFHNENIFCDNLYDVVEHSDVCSFSWYEQAKQEPILKVKMLQCRHFSFLKNQSNHQILGKS